MKIEIEKTWEDPEDSDLIELLFSAENDQFKTTIQFYACPDIFKQFAEQLSDFPFKAKYVTFKDGSRAEKYLLAIGVKLENSIGRTAVSIATQDDMTNSVKFETNVDVSAISELADRLGKVDFNQTTKFTWNA